MPCPSISRTVVILSPLWIPRRHNFSWSEHISVCKKTRRHLGYINHRFNTSPQRVYMLNCTSQPCSPNWTTAMPFGPHLRSNISLSLSLSRKCTKFAARVQVTLANRSLTVRVTPQVETPVTPSGQCQTQDLLQYINPHPSWVLFIDTTHLSLSTSPFIHHPLNY